MKSQAPQPTEANRRWLLKRADQAAVAGLVALALGLLGAWWVRQGGWRGGLVEIDRAPVRAAVFHVDVNGADWPELALLPGLGEGLARRIVEDRQVRGPFADHESLRRVRGIGPVTLERMKPFLRPIPETGNMAGK